MGVSTGDRMRSPTVLVFSTSQRTTVKLVWSNCVYFGNHFRKYNTDWLKKDPRCLTHMFAVEEFLHDFLMESPVRTLIPEEADWFYAPVYTTCDLTPNGLPLPFKSPRVMRSAISYISKHWPYWNRTEGADHFFVVPHDFAACFHYQVPSFLSPSHAWVLFLEPLKPGRIRLFQEF